MTPNNDEKVKQWLTVFKECCENAGIPIDSMDEKFRLVEKFFWIGLIQGTGPVNVPGQIQLLLMAGRSPVLALKAKRIRKPRTPKKPEAPQ